ncbi:MAG: ABC transporter ATP-binding protein [Acidimicrobiia bacterium]
MSDTIVEVRGLTKRYGRVQAVAGLDFEVGQGQVCGLLGPNGAGKTTALRMLVGLIQPTAGEARLFDRPVRPGVPELARVGTMIEQAAFVPHLSGMRNLRLWWEAGGTRWSEADLEGALEVAGLGDAIERRVKTYSQGMRQRLGLARVLLGRPELLLLDEPTNGLDPQEMRAVRELLRRLAEAGSTVLLSSHLLAEIEQICSHVVVMDKGQLVTAGTVGALLATSTTAYFEVDDAVTARRVLSGMPGVGNVTDESPGLSVELDGAQRSALVAALVNAGVAVETVTARHQLEDAFLGLVGRHTERHIGKGA